jgi:2-(1,2-epoxy-1,2-dihydrophenyl)acetyl-CoA isomerase
MEPVTSELDGRILWVTLNRPQVLNAVDVATHHALQAALRLAAGAEVGAVVLTGAGRGFCVGQDLAEFGRLEWDAGEHLRRFYNPAVKALRALRKPVIAAVNGITAGAGIGLACACDLRVAAESARFTPAFDAVALVPDSGTSFFVPRLMGRAAGFAWLTAGTTLEAGEALAKGLVDEVVPDARLRARAGELAAMYAARPAGALGMTKRLLQGDERAELERHLELEAQLQRAAAASPEHQVAVAAFLARRRGET